MLLLVVISSSKAQRYNLAIGAEINIPSGNSSNISAIGFGGGLKAEIGLSRKFAFTANGNFHNFIGKRYFGVSTQDLTAIPIKAGFKYYTSADFYFEGQLGAAFPLKSSSKTGLAWSPGFGTYLKLKGTNSLDVGLRYEGWTNSRISNNATAKFSTFNFIALRAAYVFSFN